ncbi:MAG: GNAT family N-acetyltransferase [Acidimicrobiaceae bacterium]|nr:GNAT family N-acetyltransferase [Acidimicrobiaceae bacterium]
MDTNDSSTSHDKGAVDLNNAAEFGKVRAARSSDIDGIVCTLTSAFLDDPLWGPTFPDETRRSEQASAFWRLLATSAERYPWSFVTERVESTAIWIPSGGDELTSTEEDTFEDYIVEIAGRQVADTILAINELFREARPSEPHHYLSLLATHNQHRGHGTGMNLLRENLARIDTLGVAAYLESTNSANNERYESVGFRRHGSFATPSGHTVTTMWRSANK